MGTRSLTIILLLVAVGAVTISAALYPPVHFHLGGTDASNYANAAEQYRRGREAGHTLLPPELENSSTADELASMVLKGERRQLTPFVFVEGDRSFSLAHRHLSARLTAAVDIIGFGTSAAYVNFALLAVSSILVGLLLRTLGYGFGAALLACLLMAFLPSHVELARYPMSEPLATTLTLCVLVLASAPKTALTAIPALPLVALPHVRSEFALMLVMAVAFLAARRPRGWLPVTFLLAISSWVDLSDSTVADGFSVFSYEFVPAFSLPTGSALLNVLTDPGDANSLVLTALVGGLAVGAVRPIRAQLSHAIDWSARIANGRAPWVIVGLVAVVLIGDRYKATLGPEELVLGMFRPARYATSWLIWQAAGIPLLIFGLVGLALALNRLIERLSPIGWIVVLPLLGVLLDMHATPVNQLWWTRRLHLIVFPALILGAAVAFDYCFRLVSARMRSRGYAMATISALLLAFLGLHVAAVGGRLPQVRDGYLNASLAAEMHESFKRFPTGSLLLTQADPWGQKAVLPARTFHDLYMLVVWDASDLNSLLALTAKTNPAVYVDKRLLATPEEFDKPQSQEVITVPVRQRIDEGRNIEFVLVK